MACTDGNCSTGTGITCGTGGWNGPKPGDPDNNSVLSATPAFGGIDVTWTYPLVNPFAVSHINVFRGTTDNPDLAVRRNIASGTYYYDKIPSDEIREYFYWIQFVSSNGTYADWIGPVSATPKASISEVLAQLSGKINEGVLSQALQDKLGEITLLKTSLDAEINARLLGGAAMAEALTAVQSETAQALTFFSDEITQRTTADEALLNSVNVLAVGMGDNAAAIANEAMVRATDMSAVAAQISTVQTTLNGQIVGVEIVMGAAIQDLEQTTDALGAQYTVKLTADGLVGGFGAYNDGTTVQAGFDVDTFWVGRTQADKLKPFVVDGDTVFLSNTVVPTIESNNYEAGVSGWKIRKEGPAEFNEIIIRESGVFGGALSAATGTFSGALMGATGTFSGRLTAGVLDPGAFAGQTLTYGTPGTYIITVPTDTGWSAVNMRFTLQGAGGGGGGGCASANMVAGVSGGGGGAGSAITITLSNVTPGLTYTLVVGAGGAGVPENPTGGLTGGNGGNTTLSGYSANGGMGGTGGNPYAPTGGTGAFGKPLYGVPGVGGSLGGQNGSLGAASEYVSGGRGGSSAYGMGGVSDTAGGIGAGGGGGSTGPGDIDRGSAPGGHGYAIVEFYDPNSVVTNIRYSNLITWLDSVGHGAVPANAR